MRIESRQRETKKDLGREVLVAPTRPGLVAKDELLSGLVIPRSEMRLRRLAEWINQHFGKVPQQRKTEYVVVPPNVVSFAGAPKPLPR
jgi:hypothetical protein